MDYRSDVRMVIRGPKELILAGFGALLLTGDQVMREATEDWRVMDDGVQKTVGEPDIPLAVAILGQDSSNWKWREIYKDVQAHEAVFRHFEELYNDFPTERPHNLLNGAFARIGEDTHDITTSYWGDEPYDLLSVWRTIDCPYDAKRSPDLRESLAQA